jgi:hypothetical protein
LRGGQPFIRGAVVARGGRRRARPDTRLLARAGDRAGSPRESSGSAGGYAANPEIPSPSEGKQTAANPSVKHRQGEAVRSKFTLTPSPKSAIVMRPAACQLSRNQVVRKMPLSVCRGTSRHGQSARVGRIDHRGCRWAQPWDRDPLSSLDRPAAPPRIVAAPEASTSDRT